MNGVALLIQSAIAAYLILGEPFYGRWEYQRLVGAGAGDPAARIRFYRNIVALEWGLSLLALATVALKGEALTTLGLAYAPLGSTAISLLAGAAVGLVAPVALGFLSARYREGLTRQMEPVQAMLPLTRSERRWYALLALTAGICEELLFRGFLFYYLSDLAPGIPAPAILIITSLVFGLAHLYQGWSGVLGTSLLGGFLGILYLLTGSLFWPMALHAVIDLKVLTLPLPPTEDSAS